MHLASILLKKYKTSIFHFTDILVTRDDASNLCQHTLRKHSYLTPDAL